MLFSYRICETITCILLKIYNMCHQNSVRSLKGLRGYAQYPQEELTQCRYPYQSFSLICIIRMKSNLNSANARISTISSVYSDHLRGQILFLLQTSVCFREVCLYWLNMTKFELKHRIFLYMIILTIRKRLHQRVKAPLYRNYSF